MALKITRNKDNRVVKCIHHRLADIPGGVTVKVADLGGSALLEGTPIGKGADGIFEVVKTAKIITNATNAATTYDVAKGHHFTVGDHIGTADCDGQVITDINKTNAAKDVITVGTTLGAAITAGTAGAIAFETAGVDNLLCITPIAIVGSNEDVVAGENLFVPANTHAVVNEENAPVVNDLIKAALKCVVYV